MTDTYTLRLPYATPPLSLNGRMHWATKARITAEIRTFVALSCRGIFQVVTADARMIHVELIYTPRDSRRRDRDNLVATLKPCIDGLVDAGIVPDDSPEYVTWTPPIIAPADSKDPRLELSITAIRSGENQFPVVSWNIDTIGVQECPRTGATAGDVTEPRIGVDVPNDTPTPVTVRADAVS